jgi:hypothetical protein
VAAAVAAVTIAAALVGLPAAGAATPSITATPTANLPFRGFAAVKGRNLPANTAVRAVECSGTTCQDAVTATTDASGAVDLAVPFRRKLVDVVTVNENGAVLSRVDCLDADATCAIVLQTNAFPVTTFGSVPLAFNPSAPVPPAPTLVVTPSTNLAARPIVGISGSGYFPKHAVTIGECMPGVTVFNTELCGGPTSTTVADATGHISTIAIVGRWYGSGLTVTDCAATVGACTFRATTDPSTFYVPDATEVARLPLGFDPTTTPPPGPPVSVTPRTALADQQVVTVAGSKFAGDHRIAIVPCRNASLFTPTDCDTSDPVTFLADGTGAFSQQFAVPQFFVDGHGQTVDCGASTPTCMLAIVDQGDSTVATFVPVTFAAHGPIPTVAFRSRSITEPTGTNHSTKIDLVLSEPTTHQVSVDWNNDFSVGTASQYADYVPKSRTTIIPAGQTVATVLIDVVGDTTDEPDEWFPMHIMSALGATPGPDARVTIKDDDPAPVVRLGNASIREQSAVRYAQIPVHMDRQSAWPVTVHFATHEFTARAGSDFVDATGTLTIPPNVTDGNIAVVILGDNVHESTETLLVTIDSPTRATIGKGDAVLTITDDD